jgi:cytochrome oxidase Cu insertion factor (SCO1/SenC/PrrC family)
MQRSERLALAALAAILAISAGWWAAALWPLPPGAPDWVVRARLACFGNARGELPNGGGWLLLLGSPPAMLAALFILYGDAVRRALGALGARPAGRAAAALFALAVAGTMAASGARAAAAAGIAWPATSGLLSAGDAARTAAGAAAPEADPALLRRLDRAAPPLRLTDQHGRAVSLDDFAGRTVLVAFAYARCHTICPVIVQETLAARREAAAAVEGREGDVVALVVTLDPWRDTPARLPHIAASWAMADGELLLGGSVADVEAALDAWEVPRGRDPRTGEIDHPSLVYVVDREGRIAFGVPGRRDWIRVALAASGPGTTLHF